MGSDTGGWRGRARLATHRSTAREELMGYFDGLTSGSFKTTQDGRRLFFPVGLSGPRLRSCLGQRRRAPAPSAQNLLHRHVGGDRRHIGLPRLYRGGRRRRGLHRLLRDLGAPSGGRPPACRRGHVVPREFGIAGTRLWRGALWLLEICSLLFVAGGIFMYVADPTNRPMALFSIIFFGCCAASIGYMIAVRRRAPSPP